jgi:hypothetical protein
MCHHDCMRRQLFDPKWPPLQVPGRWGKIFRGARLARFEFLGVMNVHQCYCRKIW